MRKGSPFNLGVVAVLCVSSFFVFLTWRAIASPLPMPDIKDQFQKKNVKTSTTPATLQADQVSYSAADNKAHAKGHVVVNDGDQHLFCDRLELDRVVQQVVAEGDVYLMTPKEQVVGEGLTYNFNDGTGEFRESRVYIDPYQIEGQRIDKVSQDHMIMTEGYLTTCDLDHPHYRIGAHRMDVYMKDKAIIHGMKIYLGTVPVMYLPYYVQDLKNRSMFTFIPGEKKDFGFFLLSTARFRVGSHVLVSLHEDMREREGFGEGIDVKYDTPNFGVGFFTAYYTAENMIPKNHLWDMYSSQDVDHHTRYRVLWRHRWRIDKNTYAIWQYYKIHDYDILNQGFLKRYFPREYQQNAQNSNYDTYFLLTHNMPHGTLTLNIDTSRQNPAIQGVQRIPEIQYTINNQQIGKTGFYAKSVNTYSDLTYQNYPKTFNDKTQRFDSNDEISRPFKVGFISFNPHVGGEETYYSRTADINDNNILRGMFVTGMDMSTRFYKVWNDYHTNFAGLNINGLRHVITPTISYLYQARPTFPASELDQFDTIDDLFEVNQLEFGLENELQTKRNGETVDLLRFLITVNYGLKGTTGHRGFDPYDTTLDFNPTDWWTLHNDNEYDFHEGHFNSENFDTEFHHAAWSFSLGNLYTRTEADMITTEWDYTINPKWRFKIYNTFPVRYATDGNLTSARENEYTLTRDLHEWEMDFTIDQWEGQGTTFFVLMRLKASPDMKFNLLNSTFQPSRPGSQNQ